MDGPPILISQACRFPAGRPRRRESADQLALIARVRPADGSEAIVTVSSRRFLYGARICLPGFMADDDAFCVEPGHAREIRLRSASSDVDRRKGSAPSDVDLRGGSLRALNLIGRLGLEVDGDR